MKWIVENMKRRTGTGLVVEVAYRVVAKQGSLIANHRGKVTLTGDPSSPGFVPFKDLTEAQVIQWVKDSVDVTAIEAQVQAALDAKIAKRDAKEVLTGLPWSGGLIR
jgi:hypothetical protein